MVTGGGGDTWQKTKNKKKNEERKHGGERVVNSGQRRFGYESWGRLRSDDIKNELY